MVHANTGAGPADMHCRILDRGVVLPDRSKPSTRARGIRSTHLSTGCRSDSQDSDKNQDDRGQRQRQFGCDAAPLTQSSRSPSGP